MPAAGRERAFVADRVLTVWGGPIVRRGALIDPSDLPGWLALDEGGMPLGYVLFESVGDECEIVALEALRRREGVGSALVDAVIHAAESARAAAVWLVTTNDNAGAIAFYETRGFSLCAVRPGAVDEARRSLKPTIPLVGESGVPIRDELEYRLALSRG